MTNTTTRQHDNNSINIKNSNSINTDNGINNTTTPTTPTTSVAILAQVRLHPIPPTIGTTNAITFHSDGTIEGTVVLLRSSISISVF